MTLPAKATATSMAIALLILDVISLFVLAPCLKDIYCF